MSAAYLTVPTEEELESIIQRIDVANPNREEGVVRCLSPSR